jgi:uncharacterized phage protein (TIGR01671 family)
MKENKFRYTCKRDNGHVFSQIFTLEQIEAGDAKRWIDANFVGMFHLKKDQFTGLHDKNGKEIYEGDVVRYNHSVAQYNFPLVCIAQVVYWNEHCKFRLEGNNSTDLHEDIFWSEIEVIGNIWENPELLKIEDLIDQVENPY